MLSTTETALFIWSTRSERSSLRAGGTCQVAMGLSTEGEKIESLRNWRKGFVSAGGANPHIYNLNL